MRLFWRPKSDGGFGGEIQKGKGFLQVKSNLRLSMTPIADRGVLSQVKVEVAASGRENESAVNSGRPDNLSFEQAFDVFEHGVAVVAGFGKFGVCNGAEQNGIGTIDPDGTQLA